MSHSTTWEAVRKGPHYELWLDEASRSTTPVIVEWLSRRSQFDLPFRKEELLPGDVEIHGSVELLGSRVPIGVFADGKGKLTIALPLEQLEKLSEAKGIGWSDVDLWLANIARDLARQKLITAAGIGTEDSLAEIDHLGQLVPAQPGEPAITFVDADGTSSKRRLPVWS